MFYWNFNREEDWFAFKFLLCVMLLPTFLAFILFVPMGINFLIGETGYGISFKVWPFFMFLIFMLERIFIKTDLKTNKRKFFGIMMIEALLSILLSIGFCGLILWIEELG